MTIVELSSVYSRAGMESPAALALYSIEKVGAELVDLDMETVIREALKLSSRLRLKTLDLLHISASLQAGCRFFMTLDKEIRKASDEIGKMGIRII